MLNSWPLMQAHEYQQAAKAVAQSAENLREAAQQSGAAALEATLELEQLQTAADELRKQANAAHERAMSFKVQRTMQYGA